MAILWRVTLAVAALLLIFTLILAVKVRGTSPAMLTGTINNQSATVYLRNRPTETGRTLAVLDPGTAVEVDRSTTADGITWYHIRTDSGSGWVPETNLNLGRP